MEGHLPDEVRPSFLCPVGTHRKADSLVITFSRRWSNGWGRLALLLLATFLLRLPTLFEPPWYDDEGIYAAIAHAMLEGGTLYRDILDNRPPGIYWLYAVMLGVSDYSLAFVKLTATAFLIATQVLLFVIGRRLWNPAAGLLAAGALGLLGTIYVLEGNTANAEIFMMLPTAAAALLVLQGRYVPAGICFGLAFLIKQIAGLELLACLLVLLRVHPRPWRPVALLAAGMAAPLATAAFYLLWQGSLGDFLFAGVGYYVGYVQRDARLSIGWMGVRTLLLVWVTVWVLWRTPRDPKHIGFPLATLWAAFGLFGALFTARSYPHYLLQAIPPFSLLLGGLAFSRGTGWLPSLTRRRWAPVWAASAAALMLLAAIYSPWPARLMPWRITGYYQNFAMHAAGLWPEGRYNDFFDRRVTRNLAIAEFLEAHARPDDYLVVWGEEPWLYPLSGLRLGMPYSVSYFAYEMPGGLHRVVQSLRENRPIYVVWTLNKPLYPELKAELETNYTPVFRLENAEIYVNSRTLVQRRAQQPRVNIDAGRIN